MIDAKYLIVINVSTAGLQDDDLGSDEEEVILFAWMVIDTTRCEVRFSQGCIRERKRERERAKELNLIIISKLIDSIMAILIHLMKAIDIESIAFINERD